jgi:phosphate/sulfate permease
MSYSLIFIGFLLASYSIVANDAIQTLGTFLSSNAQKPWWLLWLFACGILTFVLLYGWFNYQGDPSYGRLENIPFPTPFTWIYIIPPLGILLLTNLGIPVSTTFLILTLFAPENLGSMLTKSILGYGLAFSLGLGIYKFTIQGLETDFLKTSGKERHPYWTVLQWSATAFLWSQWLIQDLANIFVYLPRQINLQWLLGCLVVMLSLHAIIFYRNGGEIQKIVTNKTNTHDIRSATIIDLLYGFILLFFKEYSHVPMSTTWIFLGLLAGREVAITLNLQHRSLQETGQLIFSDAGKAIIGLAVSIVLALGLPWVADAIG